MIIFYSKSTQIINTVCDKVNTFLSIYLVTLFSISICNLYGQVEMVSKEKLTPLELEDEIKNYKQKADSLTKIKKVNEAIKWYELAYQKAKDSENVSLIIEIGNVYANFLYWKANKSEEALTICKTVQQFCDINNHRKSLIESYLLQAHILTYSKNQYYEALQAYSNTISLLDESISSDLAIKSYRKRGSLLGKINLVEAARKDYNQALSYVKSEKNQHQKIALFYNISTTIDKEDLDSFLYYYNNIKDYCDQKDPKFWACPLNYKNMSIFYTFHNNPEKAKKIIEENIDTNKEYAKTFYSSYSCLHTLGTIYLGLKKYDLAIKTLQLAKEYAAKAKNFARVAHILKDLSQTYQKMGDLKSSIETTRRLNLMDSLSFQKIQKHVAKLEIQNKLQEKKEEVIVLKKDSEIITLKTSRVLLLSYILSILLVIGVFLFINRIVINKTEFYKLNEKVNRNRLLSLQSAMNPHFLFNTFGTLQHFILKKEIEKANLYMTTLSDLIRNVFASSNSIYIRFEDEIKILKSYIKLELGRFDHSFEVNLELPQVLTDDNPMIPSMILQPYVENAIIHGFSEKKGAKKLSLKFAPTDGKTIRCEITDNGVGRRKVEEIQKKSKIKKNLSIATKNTEERLRIINKKAKQKGTIVIHDLYNTDGNASGTKVIISLPIAESND